MDCPVSGSKTGVEALLRGVRLTGVTQRSHGVTSQAIVDGYVAQLEERLKQPVENGRITQRMAAALVEQAREKLPDLLERTWEDCGPGGFRRGGQPGRMWSFPGQSDL